MVDDYSIFTRLLSPLCVLLSSRPGERRQNGNCLKRGPARPPNSAAGSVHKALFATDLANALWRKFCHFGEVPQTYKKTHGSVTSKNRVIVSDCAQRFP